MNAPAAQIRAHRFRTHLATIVSSVELLLHYSPVYSEVEREDLVREIGLAAQRMREMLDEAALAAQHGPADRGPAANEVRHG